MKKLSIQKVSLLGLVLLAASAVTAAIVPANKEKKGNSGVLQQDSTRAGGGSAQFTCVQQSQGNCTYTEGTLTTTNPFVDGNQTTGTSQGTETIGGDNTSAA